MCGSLWRERTSLGESLCIGQVVQLSERDLEQTKDAGSKSIAEIIKALDKLGLRLRKD